MLKRSMAALVVALSFSTSCFADVSVIVNKANTAEINVEDIKRIFLGKAQQFPNGEEAVPINLEMSVPLHSGPEMFLNQKVDSSALVEILNTKAVTRNRYVSNRFISPELYTQFMNESVV